MAADNYGKHGARGNAYHEEGGRYKSIKKGAASNNIYIIERIFRHTAWVRLEGSDVIQKGIPLEILIKEEDAKAYFS